MRPTPKTMCKEAREMREKIFEARDLEIQFNLRGRVLTAVRKASIELYSNETLAIVGESGSGKSVFTKSFLAKPQNPS